MHFVPQVERSGSVSCLIMAMQMLRYQPQLWFMRWWCIKWKWCVWKWCVWVACRRHVAERRTESYKLPREWVLLIVQKTQIALFTRQSYLKVGWAVHTLIFSGKRESGGHHQVNMSPEELDRGTVRKSSRRPVKWPGVGFKTLRRQKIPTPRIC